MRHALHRSATYIRGFLGLGLALAVGLPLTMAAAQTGPPKPKVLPGRDPGGVAVALIGAGVDYQRPDIAARLARDGEGEIIAWDVIDDDARPLEAAPVAGRRVPPHAGTAMAKMFLRSAKPVRLIPVRVPDGNPLALGGALAFACQTPARIAVLLVAGDPSPQAQSWQLFIETARRCRHLLLIVPAGQSGGDTGARALPAGVGLDNVLVVTAAGSDGRIAAGASWGASTVDVAFPFGETMEPAAEDRAIVLENRAAIAASVLAASLAADEAGLDAAALKARLLDMARPLPGKPAQQTRFGWFPPPPGNLPPLWRPQ